jgi:hypothetical protein
VVCNGGFHQQTTTFENTIGPGNICVGPNRTVSCFVPAGETHLNILTENILPPGATPTCDPATTPCQFCAPPPPCTPSSTLCEDFEVGGTDDLTTILALSTFTCQGAFDQVTVFVEDTIGPAQICIGADKSVGCTLLAGTTVFNTHALTIVGPSPTPTETPTPSATLTPTGTATQTPTPSSTPSASATPTITSTATQSSTPSSTATPSTSPTASVTRTASNTPTASSTPTITNTPAVLAPVAPAIPALSGLGAVLLGVLFAGLGVAALLRWRS